MKNYLSGILILVLFSCNGKDSARSLLKEAEESMSVCPARSLALLEELDTSVIGSASLRARYSLLYSQALDKNSIDLKSDSLLQPAAGFYLRKGNARQKALFYYYLGRIYYNAGKDTLAVRAFLQAEQWCDKTTDNYLNGLIHYYMGKLYHSREDFTHALEKYELSEKYNIKEGNVYNELYLAAAMAKVYYQRGEYDRALALSTEAERKARDAGDPKAAYLLASNIASVYVRKEGEYEKALKYLRHADTLYRGGYTSPSNYPLLIKIYLRLNRPEQARSYLDKGRDSSGYFRPRQLAKLTALESELEEQYGNYREALRLKKKFIGMKDSIFRAERANQILKIEKNYKNRILENENYYFKKLEIYGMIIIFLLLVIGFYISYRLFLSLRRKVIRKHEIEIAEYERLLEKIRAGYASLLKKQNTLVAPSQSYPEKNILLWRELIESANNYSGRKALFYDKFQTLLREDKDKTVLRMIRTEVDSAHYRVISRLKEKCPALNEDELDLCSLLVLGISGKAICLILDIGLPYLHNKQYHIRKKLGLVSSGINIKTHIQEMIKELSHEAPL